MLTLFYKSKTIIVIQEVIEISKNEEKSHRYYDSLKYVANMSKNLSNLKFEKGFCNNLKFLNP